MQGPIIIKFGGGLITVKDKLCTPKIAIIHNLAKSVQHLVNIDKRVIIVHGAGSFGHLRAKSWKLHEGRTNEGLPKEDDLSTQDEAVESVRQDMQHLNQLVVEEFNKLGIETVTHPPHEWATGTGSNFSGELHQFNLDGEKVHITYGDVVDCNNEKEFGILSGDDICYRLATELKATHMIFAMGGAPGVMSSPPSEPSSELIPIWSKYKQFEAIHQSEIDVTGGIHLKLTVADKISKIVPMVWIVDGECPERIVQVVLNNESYGTRIIPESP